MRRWRAGQRRKGREPDEAEIAGKRTELLAALESPASPVSVAGPGRSGMTARLAVSPGVFDPPTWAHLALIEAALGLIDRLTAVVAVNPSKSASLFAPDVSPLIRRDQLVCPAGDVLPRPAG